MNKSNFSPVEIAANTAVWRSGALFSKMIWTLGWLCVYNAAVSLNTASSSGLSACHIFIVTFCAGGGTVVVGVGLGVVGVVVGVGVVGSVVGEGVGVV